MSAPAVQPLRPGTGLGQRLAPALLGACLTLLAAPAAFAFAPQKAAPAAEQDKKQQKSDQLFVRSKKDGSVQLLAGMVSANHLDAVTIQVAGKDTKVDSDGVVRIAWGEVPQSYKDGRIYLSRDQFSEAAAQFRLAAGDASARDVVKASARLLAAQALLRWGASDPLHFAEASEEAAKFQSEFATNRDLPEARMIQARAKWMAGQAAEAAQIYKSIYAEWKPTGATPGYRRETCLEAGLAAARAMLQSQPPDTLGARELFSSLDKAAGAAIAALEPQSTARPRLARIQDEASLGDGFVELAGGNSGQAKSFFEAKLSSAATGSDTTRYAATFGLAQALAALGKLRDAQLKFAQVSALEHVDRDRAAAAQVGLADTTLKLSDPEANVQARAWLDAVSKTHGDTLAALRAREMLKKL